MCAQCHQNKSNIWGVALSQSKYVTPGQKCWNMFYIYSIPRHIYVETSSLPFANTVIVWIFKVGPEFLMLVAVPGEVEHTGERMV